ncbi:MAG: NADH-quinone oxidoreductase subunit NuoE [Actinobacteria bacterium]|nr:NADH-quinone oxidoreductase subunit NuoE [Actinomycetota bacterium]
MSVGQGVESAVEAGGFDEAPLRDLLETYQDQRGALIPLLQGTQAAYGYLPAEAMESIARALREPLSQVFGVATFYAQFRLVPRARNVVRVCHGTACHVSGAPLVSLEIERNLGIGDGENTEDMMFTIENVACLGACGMAPVMMINERTYGKLSPDSAVKAVKEFRAKEEAGNGSGDTSAVPEVEDADGEEA